MADSPQGPPPFRPIPGSDTPDASMPEPDIRDHVRNQMTDDDPAEVAVHAVDEIAAAAQDADDAQEQAKAAAAEAQTAQADAEALRAENADLQDQLLRRAAEFQNYRRRAEADRDAARRAGRDSVLLPVLDVLDDLRRSLDASRRAKKQDVGAAAAPAYEALAEGVELVYQKFEDALDKLGVERIPAVGEPFSEDAHEAMMTQPSEDYASGTVIAELQPGYRTGERVIRHARVIVAQ